MAAEDFGGKVNGLPIEVIAGDHLNKPDVGASIANRWFDVDKVDAIADLGNSAVRWRSTRLRGPRTKSFWFPLAAPPR